eukprot:TRINITY_DN26892_c0_g1_i2.p1 TRINITY_DN26892_c0_g1~~TRINITY_DN26892_c0_g1_i2.p1  ORF type:complete len:614 (+),score=124.45 TRINITY_DN26892_c0_g1_i2:71-1843(+)
MDSSELSSGGGTPRGAVAPSDSPVAVDGTPVSGPGLCGSPLECGLPCCRRFQLLFRVLSATAMLLVGIEGGLSTATLTTIEEQFRISTLRMGAILAMQDIASVFAAAPVARYCGTNIPVSIGVGLLVCAASGVLYGLGESFVVFLLMRLVFGFGSTPFWMLGFVHIDDNIDDKMEVPAWHGRLLALVPVGFILGAGLAAVFFTIEESSTPGACEAQEEEQAEWCASSPAAASATVSLTLPVRGLVGCSSWRYAYFLLSALLVPLGLWLLQSRKRYECYRSPGGCDHRVRDFTPGGPGGKGTSTPTSSARRRLSRVEQTVMLREGFRAVMCNVRWLLITLGAAIGSFGGSAVVAFAPRFMERQLCQARSTAVFMVALFIPCAAAGLHVGGMLPRKFRWGVGRQLLQMSLLSNLLAAPFFLAFLSKDLVTWILPLLVAIFFQYLSAAPTVNVLQRVVEPEQKAFSASLFNIPVRILGSVPGPIVLGALLDSASWCYVLVGMLSNLLSAVLWFVAWMVHGRGVADGTWLDLADTDSCAADRSSTSPTAASLRARTTVTLTHSASFVAGMDAIVARSGSPRRRRHSGTAKSESP